MESYLFAEVARRASKYEAEHPDVKMIRMGIGDVTRPLPPVVTEAMKDASDEMGRAETFRGYGPYEGYDFLRLILSLNIVYGYGISVGRKPKRFRPSDSSGRTGYKHYFSHFFLTFPHYPQCEGVLQ